MNLTETFNKLNLINEEQEASLFAKEVAKKDALDAKKQELAIKLNDWDRAEVETKRSNIKKVAKQLITVIPSFNEIKRIPEIRNAALSLGTVAAKNTVNDIKSVILRALRSEEGLTFSVDNSVRPIVFKNAHIEPDEHDAIKFVKDYGTYCLDLNYLTACTDPDAYEDDYSEDPGNLSASELNEVAASINTIAGQDHWFVPVMHEAIHFENITVDRPQNNDNTALLDIVERVQTELLGLSSELNLLAGFGWESNANFLKLADTLKDILTTEVKAFTPDFNTSYVYKAIFSKIEMADSDKFKELAEELIKLIVEYNENFGEYDSLTKEFSDVSRAVSTFKFSKPVTDADKKAKAELSWKKKKTKFENDFKELIDKTKHLTETENYWFALGWLAKHITKIRVFGPEELRDVYPYSTIGYEVTTEKGYVNQSGIPNFAASASVVLDSELGVCLPAYNLIGSLVVEGNAARSNATLVHQTKDVTPDSKKINSLNVALYLVDVGFECGTTQEPSKIAPSTNNEANYNAFYEGYNS